MTPLRAAIIGCGRIAFEFERDPLRKKPASHFGAISSLPEHYTLQAVCDKNPERLNSLRSRFTSERGYTSHRELFRKERPEVVIIAASTPAHVTIARHALESGVRGVILEKPVSTSLHEAMKLLRLQEQAKVPILVFHERRYDPLYQWAFSVIKQEHFGAVHSVSARLCSASFPHGPVDRPYTRYGGGALLHDGTHMIDILNYLFSPPESVSAHMKHQLADAATETSMHCLLQTGSGIPVYFDIDGMSAYFHFELDILFRRARLRIGNGIRDLYISQPARLYSGFNALQPESFPAIPSDSPFTEAYMDLYRAVKEGRPLRSSLRDGITSLERIYGIYRSARHAGRTVRFPLPSYRHPLAGVSFYGHCDSVTKSEMK